MEGVGKRLGAFRITIIRGNLQPDELIRLFTHAADHPTGWHRPETTGDYQDSHHQYGN